MLRTFVIAGATLASLAPACAVAADRNDPNWFVRGAVTRLELADEIKLDAGGAPVPGADMKTEAHYTPTVQIGHFIGRNFAASLTVGIPPHIEIYGAGTLQPLGRLAETTYGPATLTLQYRPLREGVFQPYVGAGAAYMIIFSTTEGAFKNVEIDNDLAPAVELGSDFMISKRFGLFVEAKRAWLRTQARGTFNGIPVVGDVRLDPWAVSAGAVIRF